MLFINLKEAAAGVTPDLKVRVLTLKIAEEFL
jgi:hypothetical protein